MRVAFVITACFVSFGASAQTGAGLSTCGEFAYDYRNDPQLIESIFFSWAQGFMAGMNASIREEHTRNLGSAEFGLEDQQAFLRRYCDEHPLVPYYEGVVELFNTLPRAE